jgi:hypothetical protein
VPGRLERILFIVGIGLLVIVTGISVVVVGWSLLQFVLTLIGFA